MTWQNRDDVKPGAFNNTHRMTSPSSKQTTNLKSSPNNGNMNLRSSLRLGMTNSRNTMQTSDIPSSEDFRIIHTNNAHLEQQIWNKTQELPTGYSNIPSKGFETHDKRLTAGAFGGAGYDDETGDHESNFDSYSNITEGGSLNVMRRREPLGASGNKPEHPKSPSQREIQREKAHSSGQEIKTARQFSDNINPNSNFVSQTKRQEENTHEIVIQNEIGPLGIHVVPRGEDGRLLVQGIEPGGRVDRDGRLAVGDEILCINGYPLYDTAFDKAQEIFKEALYAKELRLEVVKGNLLYGEEMSPEGRNNVNEDDKPEGIVSDTNTSSSVLPKPSEPLAAGTKITSAVHANNTRKIGKKIHVTLRKGHAGLGFSITTRDNALGNATPIYIKNIMAKGAAIEEGSLKPGDRLLEVNQVTVDGMTQSEVVTLLKNAPLNSSIYLVVSRHSSAPSQTQQTPGSLNVSSPGHEQENKTLKKDEEITTESKDILKSKLDHEKVPKKIQFDFASDDGDTERQNYNLNNAMKRNNEHELCNNPRSIASNSPITSSDNFDDAMEDYQLPWKQRQILTFDIPVHDSERAGLGVSVKGKNSNGKEGGVSEDLGIFVKSVLYGGAASQDGRLKTNDQLVNINGMSLLGKANSEAMETLRMAMHEEGPIPGVITLTVARRVNDTRTDMMNCVEQGIPNPNNQYLQHSHVKPNAHANNLTGSINRQEKRDSLSSIGITSSDDEVVREYNIAQAQPNFKMPIGLKAARNPVVDRLMGKDGSIGGPRNTSSSVGVVPSNLRNDSYYMATHDNTFLNGTAIQQHMKIHSSETTHSSTTNGTQNLQPILIEREDTHKPQNDDVTTLTRYLTEPIEPQLIISSSVEDVDATTESLTSLVEVKPQTFARDMPGRQSMSEKRHATLDAKNTDTYKKRNKAREEREKQQRLEQQQRIWKKSASLESLHMQAGDGTQLADEEREALRTAYVRANSVRVSRNRGINESFRAAVDRSYEQRDFPGMSLGQLQSKGMEDHTQRHPDFVIEDLDTANEENQSNKSNVPAQAVLRRNKSSDNKEKKNNRNSRLFTGLSNMFHKGNKKSNTEINPPPSNSEMIHSTHSLRNKTINLKPASVPNALPSNSSSVSGGSTSAIAGSSISGGLSSSSSLVTSTNMPHSQSIHGTMSGYMKSRSGGTLQKPLNEQQPNSMKNSLSGDNLMMTNQQRLQRQQLQQYAYYQQHGIYMQQAPPMPRRPAPVYDPEKHIREQLKGSSLQHREANEHARSHSHPRPPPKDMYDYLPSAMMRPGSRVGIADPLLTESTDYDVIQRLQQQPPPHQQQYPTSSQRTAPPPPPVMQQHLNLIQHHQQNSNYPYAYYPDGNVSGGQNQPFHIRSGSNLSNGSSSNNNPSSSNLMMPGKQRRPKSNYYEYESYNNNNHNNYADVQSHHVPFGGNQPTHHGEDYHPVMYSLPRSTTTLPSMHKQSHPQYFHTDYN